MLDVGCGFGLVGVDLSLRGAWLNYLVASVNTVLVVRFRGNQKLAEDENRRSAKARLGVAHEATSRMKEKEAKEAEDSRPQGGDGKGLSHLCLCSSWVVNA